MKTSKIFSLEVETVRDLVQRATAIGVPHSALADLLLRGGLETIPEAKLRAWAESHRQAKVTRTPSQRAKLSETKALSALTGDWQEFKTTRAAAEQGEAVHWRALEGLKARGLAEQRELDPPSHIDPRTKRPMVSLWRKAAA